MIYRHATSNTDSSQFQALWEDYCEEIHLPFHSSSINMTKYLILDENKAIGTVGMKSRKENEASYVEKWYPFYKHHLFAQQFSYKKGMEVGLLSLKRSERGSGHFAKILAVIAYFAIKEERDYLIGVVSNRMLLYLKGQGYLCHILEKEVHITNTIKGVAIIVDLQHAKKQLPRNAWYHQYKRYIDDTKKQSSV